MSGSRSSTLDPAPPGVTGGGGHGRWAWLLTAHGIVEAELVRGVLEEAGVPVVLDRRDPSPFAWMYLAGNVNAPVQVLVPAGLLDAARLAVLDAGLEAPAGAELEATPPLERGRAFRMARLALGVTVVMVAGWIVLITLSGRATCILKLFC